MIYLHKQITFNRVMLLVLLLPFAWYIYREAVRDVVIIDSISVPKQYEELGFTASMMTLQVADELQRIERLIHSTSGRDQLQQSSESRIPDIEVPSTKLSLKTGVQLVQQAFHYEPKHIRGEITYSWAGSNATTNHQDQKLILWYHIYDGSQLRRADQEEIAANDPDTVVQKYAEGLLKRVNFYLWAIYLGQVKNNLSAEREIAEELVSSDTPTESAKGYVLLGNVLNAQGKSKEAIEKYRKALELNPKFEDAYENWGIALSDPEEGIRKFRKALELQPNLPVNTV